jgi:type II secretory pathway component PulF
MIRAGETAGTLDDVLGRIADLLERSNATRKRTMSAIAYPATVTVTAFLLVLFLVGTVVPTIRDVFRGFDRQLPLMTRGLIATGDILHDPYVWIACFGICIAGTVALRMAMRNEHASRFLERRRQALPVVGRILRLAEISACTRTLGTLLQTGVALETAFSITSDVLSSKAMRDNLAGIAKNARFGQSLAPAFAAGGLYDTHFIALIRAGEEAGTLSEMLLRVSEYADVDIESAIAALSTLLEPVLIVVIGCIVGFIVAAILIPLYSAIGSIS